MKTELLLQELYNLTHVYDKDGNVSPFYCLVNDIAYSYDLDEEELINIACKNGYTVYKVLPKDEIQGDYVICASEKVVEQVLEMYKDFYDKVPQLEKYRCKIEEYYNRKWTPSKTAKREFAQKMSEIEQFCHDNNISSSYTNDSYYFTINGQKYRVSNHSVESSNANSGGKYHSDGREDDTIYIHASKTRIIDIYNNLKQGKKLDGRGDVIRESKANLKNELKDRAKRHRKSDKKGARGWFVHPNAGNVEYNVAFFNHAMGSDVSSSGSGESGAMGESVIDAKKIQFLNSKDKDRVFELLDYYKHQDIDEIAKGDILCYIGAISNLFYFHNRKKNVTLYFGNMVMENDVKGSIKTISHSWIVVNGKEYHTRLPQVKVIDFYPVIKINIPKSLSNDKVAELVVSKLTTKLQEKIEKHSTLNPKLWDENQELLPAVKDKIEQIVNKFVQNLNEDEVDIKVKDIVIIGSNANYNYTKDSDLDIHIISDTSIKKDSRELLKIIYNAYKTLFNRKYEITINGINVELYVEDAETKANSNGVYSLTKGWVKKPSYEEIPFIDIDKDLKKWEIKYNKVLRNELTLENVSEFIYNLYELRQNGIKKDGEYSKGNLIFKEFRNLGYLEKLKRLQDRLESRKLSLENLKETYKKIKRNRYYKK